MENYENDELRQEQDDTAPRAEEAPQQQPSYSQPYSGAGAGRRESPYANSPYMMNHEQTSSGCQYSGYVPPVPPQEPPVKPPKYRKKKSGGKVWKPILAGVLTLALVIGSCGVTAMVVNNRWEAETEQMTLEFNSKLDQMQAQIDDAAEAAANAAAGNSVSGSPVSSEGLTPGQVYAQNVDAVVLITCQVQSSGGMYGQSTISTSSGSGFILTENGYVVTNYHVVEGASSVTVTTHDGDEYPATVVGSDSTNDVAVLKVEAEDLPTVVIGSSSDLIVGDQVVAIGNPLGELTSTMTVGYVSAMDRDVTTEGKTINMIQTDAAINSGNSGGPLFNMKGEVIGITTAKYSGSSSSGATIESIGFAIPMDDVIGMIDDLVNYGYVTGAYLGVSVKDVDTTAQYYGIPAGAYIAEVVEGYCASEAGIQVGDIIIGLGGYEVESYTDLSRALRKFKAGDTTEVTVYRSGQEITLTITLDEKPQSTDSGETAEPDASQMPDSGSYDEWYDYFDRFFGFGD